MLENFSECVQRGWEAIQLVSKNSGNPIMECECRMLNEEHVEDVRRLYESYDGRQEFLYVPPLDEIRSGVLSANSCYVGMFNRDKKLMGVAKLKRLEFPYPFFALPKREEKTAGECYGLSGLMVASEYRNKGVAKKLVNVSLGGLHLYGAKGIYADCEYRNKASFLTLSHTLSFIGFVDGRNGAEGEKTIYLTFYRNCAERYPNERTGIKLDFSKTEQLDDTVAVLQKQLNRMGQHTRSKAPYQGGHNELYILDTPLKTPGIKLILGENERQAARNVSCEQEAVYAMAKEENKR